MSNVGVDEAYCSQCLYEVERRIGIFFQKRENLVSAFTRRSYTNEKTVPWDNNERLEFLGDSVLQIIVSEQLYKEYNTNEGDLTERRKEKVDSKSLTAMYKKLKIGQYLLLGEGEKGDLESLGEKFSQNVIEALIGAIYLEDKGLEKANKFLMTGWLEDVVPRALSPDTLLGRAETMGAILLTLSLTNFEQEVAVLAKALETPEGVRTIHSAAGGYLV